MDFKLNFNRIIAGVAEAQMKQLEERVMNGIFKIAITIDCPVFIDYFDNYCFTDFYIGFLLFHHPDFLFLLFLLYYFLYCFLGICYLSSYHQFNIVVTILKMVRFECFEQIGIASMSLDNLFCFKT